MSLPPLDGETIRQLQNAGFAPVVRRVIAQALPTERARERGALLRRAGALAPAASIYETALAINARMRALVAQSCDWWIDAGTFDGLLACALLVNGLEIPSVSTIRRDLGASH